MKNNTVFCFNDSIFKYKLENLLFKLSLELNKELNLMFTTYDGVDCLYHNTYKIQQTNLKYFNYELEDKGKIISFFKNNGFKYNSVCKNGGIELKNRLIFKYVSCLYE
jgi:hypothetical protein